MQPALAAKCAPATGADSGVPWARDKMIIGLPAGHRVTFQDRDRLDDQAERLRLRARIEAETVAVERITL